MRKTTLELSGNAYARKYSYARPIKSTDSTKRKFSLNETQMASLRLKYMQQQHPPGSFDENNRENCQTGKRLSECKVYYSRESSEISQDSNDSHNSMTSLGHQIYSILGLPRQVSINNSE